MSNLLTYSRLQCFRACPRRHELRYEIGIEPEEPSVALRVGTAFHAAQEACDLGLDVDTVVMQSVGDPYMAALVMAMFTVHREQPHGDEEVVATELGFDLPLTNPETGAASKVWRLAGKIDRIYRSGGRLIKKDYKTTTEDISPGSDYWLRLSLDQQMSIYLIAARELGHDIQSILYDVTVRPQLRPHKATPPEERKYTQKASKLADGTVRPAGSLYAGQREVDETPVEFCVRVADTMRANPSDYFARHEIPRLDSDLEEARREMWSQQQTMREMQRRAYWYRNPGSCVTPYRCAYLPICQGQVSQDRVPAGFRLLADVHPELSTASPGQAGQGV